ncbi:unnamed protein product [Brassica rapa]|uniref:Uncharacterized protein n=1 Tax=Brassica campestris TaxID=3711 RepID=A0A8D9DID2_BRACM|nr:unnamed protein product [Brassica rapa]
MCTDGQPRTSSTDVLCVLMNSHGRPLCAGGHPQTFCPTWAKITRTIRGKGQRADSKDQRADMYTDGQPRTSSTDVLCVLTDTHTPALCVPTDTHGRPVPRGPESPKQSTGRAGMLSPRTNVLICVLTDTHGRPPLTSCVCWRTPTDVFPRGPKSPEQSTGRVSVLSPSTNVVICVLMDSHGHPVCADGHTRTHTDVMCVLTDTHGQPKTQPTWAKITRTIRGKGQRADSKDQRADMCADGHPRTSCSTGRASVLSPRTNMLICVLMDNHGRPVCANGHTRTATNVLFLCVLNRQPTWAKITQTVHKKGQRAESKDQRADMCTDGQPRTSCVC